MESRVSPSVPPVIVTLDLDGEAQAAFEALRRTYFPPERNLIPAHVTLFHALPGDEVERIAADAGSIARTTPVFPISIEELRSLGHGWAIALASPVLMEVHARLSARWNDWLTPQDRQGYRPHVVVQNKVSAEEATASRAAIGAEPLPKAAEGRGITLWAYLGGPWSRIVTMPFARA